MRLFLSSQDLGNFDEDLRQLVGDNRKTLLITNARDYKESNARAERVAEKIQILQQTGFQVEELDLREYFSKDPSELQSFIEEYDPGLVYSMGGDVFLLGTALKISGMDEILHQRLMEDITVYAGHSAGAMVASKDIEAYERDELKPEEVSMHYEGAEPITNGLGLIDEYIIPHADWPERKITTEMYLTRFAKIGANSIVLNDGDAYIVNGNHKIIKRAE